MLAMAVPRGFFRVVQSRSYLLGGVAVVVGWLLVVVGWLFVMGGWLCVLVSVGVCSVTCGHSLWPVIGVLTAGRAVVPTAIAVCRRVACSTSDSNASARGAKAISAMGREGEVSKRPSLALIR